MPLAPQITNTPIDITPTVFAITGVAFTSTTATYACPGHTFANGSILTVSDVAPDGYNGTFTISSVVAGTSFTVPNTTNATVTTGTGTAWQAPTDHTLDDNYTIYMADSNDVATALSTAMASAAVAEADAQTAITNASTAISNAATAQAAAIAAATQAGTAQTTANGKNTVHYSGSTPGATVNVIGDIWWQFSGSIIIAQWTGAGGTSWTPSTLANSMISSLDVGKLTAGTITVALGLTNPSGNFSVNASTGQLICTNAIVTGQVTATSGTFTGTVYASSGTFTGAVTATSGSFTGSIYANAGNIGNFNISAGGYLTYGTTSLFGGNGTSTFAIADASKGGYFYNILTNGGGISANSASEGSTFYNLTVGNSIGGSFSQQVVSNWAPLVDNTYYLGLSSYRWKAVYAANGTIQTSDARLKTDIKPSSLGLDFINSLNPVSYKWLSGGKEIVKDDKGETVYEDVDGRQIPKAIEKPGKRVHWGLLAQEVKSAVDKSGVEDFAGWVLDDVNDPDSEQAINYQQLIAPLIKAIQELSEEVTALKSNP